MNRIQKEQAKSKIYLLETELLEEDCKIVKITMENVAKAEAMFMTGYGHTADINNETSSAYVINELRENLQMHDFSRYRNLIFEIVVRLDNENSTHLNSDKVGIGQISKRILKYTPDELEYLLKNPEESDYELIKTISKKTSPKGFSPSGRKYNAKTNLSFASKFCHYMCFFLYPGQKEQDNYSIYDSVVSKALPLYMKRYGIDENRNLKDYSVYSKTIDEVIKKSRANISRNGFDHLIWCAYK